MVLAATVEQSSTIVTTNQTVRKKVEHFLDPGDSPYVKVSLQTVFSTALLQQVTQQVVHAAATFESQADVYNATFMLHDQQCLSAYAGEFSRVRNPSTLQLTTHGS